MDLCAVKKGCSSVSIYRLGALENRQVSSGFPAVHSLRTASMRTPVVFYSNRTCVTGGVWATDLQGAILAPCKLQAK